MLKGIDPATVGQATDLARELVAGSEGALDRLAADPDAEGDERLPGVILGIQLASRFFLSPGDEVILISPLGGAATPVGPAPRMVKFRVAGIFRSDFFQFDDGIAYTSIASAQKFMKLDDVVSGIEVRTEDPFQLDGTLAEIRAHLGPAFYTRDWKSFFPQFFQALKTERVMMFVLLSFIMVVAGFIIIATLIMMIMEKSRDIAILKTMGADEQGVCASSRSKEF